MEKKYLKAQNITLYFIERAANMKRIIDEDRKIKMIADGIERAEMRKKYRSM